jgi:hypothetical protein
MALENKFIKEKKKEKETLPVQPAAWKPTRAGLLLPFLAVGPPELASPFLSRARVGRPRKPLLPRAFLSCFADERTPQVSRSFFLMS